MHFDQGLEIMGDRQKCALDVVKDQAVRSVRGDVQLRSQGLEGSEAARNRHGQERYQ